MNERAKAVEDAMITYVDDNFLDQLDTAVTEVIAAADAVMFSNEAVRRCASALRGLSGDPTLNEAHYQQARAVIAALKGAE